jgi:predicted AAA+ superfamily ATPase
MYKRYITHKIIESLKDTPVVMTIGPRQCGKTTLAKSVVSNESLYITFDDPAQLEIAKRDPVSFIRNQTATQIILDEVQRIPELLVCIKQSVDEFRKPGRYLLTGSANVLLLPQVSDSLAGRMEIIQLFPLSECEIRGNTPNFLTTLLEQKAPNTKEIRVRNSLIEKIVSGGFPEPLSRSTENRRTTWYLQYINSLIQKDLTEIANIDHLRIMPQFVKTLTVYSGNLINFTDIGEPLEISRQTTAKYFQLLEQLFLVDLLPAWHRNENKQLTKTPKVHFVDSGLLCALRRINTTKLKNDPILFGHLLETYIYCELKKQASWLEQPINFYHYRDKDKCEVDFVLEGPAGEIIGIEVKPTATLRESDFKGLTRLKESAKSDFHIGILLYDGDMTASFGENLYAVPLAAIWG